MGKTGTLCLETGTRPPGTARPRPTSPDQRDGSRVKAERAFWHNVTTVALLLQFWVRTREEPPVLAKGSPGAVHAA